MTNNSGKIFALESPPFSGKTTLLKYLKEHYSNSVITIPESGEYVGGDHNFPKIPFFTADDAKASTHFFLSIEEERFKDASRLYEKYGLPILMDRVNSISSPIFYKLLKERYSQTYNLEDSFFTYAIEMFQQAVEKGSICLPDQIIYIKVGDKDTFEARAGRKASTPVFEQWENLEYLDLEYKKILKDYGNHLVLESFNTEENTFKLAKEVLLFINQSIIYKNRGLNQLFGGVPRSSEWILSEEKEKYKKMYEESKALMKSTGLKLD